MDPIFDAFANTIFLATKALLVLRYTNVAIGAMNELHVICSFDSLSATALVSDNLATLASKFSLMTPFAKVQ